MQMTYPSPAFPAPPQVRVDVPDTWQAVATVDAELAARAPEPDGHVFANVAVKIRRAVRGTPGLDVLRQFSGLEGEGAAIDERTDPFPALIYTLGSDGPSGVPLQQIRLLAYIDGPAVAHIVSVVGTFAAAASNETKQLVSHILRSVEVDVVE